MRFKITFGSGLAWPIVQIVETEEWQSELDALDILIDRLEQEGLEGLFLSQNELNSGEYHEDEYIIGGNHGRALLHHGNLFIEKLTKEAV